MGRMKGVAAATLDEVGSEVVNADRDGSVPVISWRPSARVHRGGRISQRTSFRCPLTLYIFLIHLKT